MLQPLRNDASIPKNSDNREEDSPVLFTRRQMAAARDGRRASSYLANTNPLFASRRDKSSRSGRSQTAQIRPENNNNNKENQPPTHGTGNESASLLGGGMAKARPFSHGYEPRRSLSLAQAYEEVILQDLADLESQLGIEMVDKSKNTTVDTLADLEKLERDLGIQVTSENQASQPQLPVRTWGSKARNYTGYLKNINDHAHFTFSDLEKSEAQSNASAKHQPIVEKIPRQKQDINHKAPMIRETRPQALADIIPVDTKDSLKHFRMQRSHVDGGSEGIHSPKHSSDTRSVGNTQSAKLETPRTAKDDVTATSSETSFAFKIRSQSTSPNGPADGGKDGSRPRLTKEYITDALRTPTSSNSSSASETTGRLVGSLEDRMVITERSHETVQESVDPRIRPSVPEVPGVPSAILQLQVVTADALEETRSRTGREAPESPPISPVESLPNSPSPAAKSHGKHSSNQHNEKPSRARAVPAPRVDSHETLRELSRVLTPNSNKTNKTITTTKADPSSKPAKSTSLINTAKVARAVDDLRELERKTLLHTSLSCSASSSDEHATVQRLSSKVTRGLGGIREARRGLERIQASLEHQQDSVAPIYIVVPVPRLWRSTTDNWRGWELTWLGVFLLVWSIYWLTDTIACDYYCKMDGWGNMVSPATGGPIVYAINDWQKYVRGQCPQYWDQKRCAPF